MKVEAKMPSSSFQVGLEERGWLGMGVRSGAEGSAGWGVETGADRGEIVTV